MNVFNKILTALRGSVREIGESMVDANATRIYEQELVEAKQHLAQAKQDLTLVMAKQMQAEREIGRLQAEVERYESHGAEALDKSQPQLAEEVAGHIASLERELAEQTQARDSFGANVVRLKELIRQTEYKLREHERVLAMAKTTESVYRATRSISQSMSGGGSKMIGAKESLDRIKQHHADLADRMTAAEQLDAEIGDKALEAKLAAAGIGEDADRKQAILARLAARRAGQDAKPQTGE